MTTGRSLTVAACGALLWVALSSGCAKTIGDSCGTNVECSALGNRVCDIGSPNGYCTVEGCDYQSCPDNAVCVRFYTLERSGPTCDPPTDCQPGRKCVCRAFEKCIASELNGVGYCALESSERRWCMHPCNSNSDCRNDGYQCFSTGSNGALAVPYRDPNTMLLVDNPPQVQYCAPVPQYPEPDGGTVSGGG